MEKNIFLDLNEINLNIITSLIYHRWILVVNCDWNEWQSWSGCTVSCGGGLRTKTRTKSVVESIGGTCTGNDEEQADCNEDDCPIEKSIKFWFFIIIISPSNHDKSSNKQLLYRIMQSTCIFSSSWLYLGFLGNMVSMHGHCFMRKRKSWEKSSKISGRKFKWHMLWECKANRNLWPGVWRRYYKCMF